MKRKVVNPDIQQKKRKQAVEKELKRDLKKEINREKLTYPKKIPKERSKTGHK